MTKEQAVKVLQKHSQFFEIYIREKYVPRAMEGTLNEISAAFRVLNLVWFEANKCTNCGTSFSMLIEANRLRLSFKEEPKEEQKPEPVQMSFPKHKRKRK